MAEYDVSKLRNLHVYTDRHGKERAYVRRPRGRRVPIPAKVGSAKFLRLYRQAIASPIEAVPFQLPAEPVRKKPDVAGATVYFLRAGNMIKIGTSRDVAGRVAELQVGNAARVQLLLIMPGGRSIERKLHEQFSTLRRRGEWFEAASELTDYIKSERTKRRQKWLTDKK